MIYTRPTSCSNSLPSPHSHTPNTDHHSDSHPLLPDTRCPVEPNQILPLNIDSTPAVVMSSHSTQPTVTPATLLVTSPPSTSVTSPAVQNKTAIPATLCPETSIPVSCTMATTPISSNILDLTAFINSDAIFNEPLDLSSPSSREDVSLANSLSSSSEASSFSPVVIDSELAKAALFAVSSGSITPLIKEELRCTIQQKRLSSGKEELDITYEEAPDSQLTQEDEGKRMRRRERNRLAAQRCRSKRKSKADTLNAETDQLERANSRLRDEISELERQLFELRAMITRHDIVPSSCPSKLSVSDDDEADLIKPMDIVCDMLDGVVEENVSSLDGDGGDDDSLDQF